MPRRRLSRSAATAIAALVPARHVLAGRAPARYVWALFVLAASVLALAGLSPSASAAGGAAARQAGGTVPVSLAITSVSPAYARPGRTVTVSGTLTNISKAKISGLSIQLRSSGNAFTSRGLLQQYANDTTPSDVPMPGTLRSLKPLAPHTTLSWSVALHGNQLPMSVFGVYPLAAEVDNSNQTPLAVSRTFLPFWPGTKGLDPVRQDVAWIWPLIDQPRQAACPGLMNNGLAASFGRGGRLSGLLEAGRAWARSAHLTWAIDPALLANAATMSKPYRAGGIAGCNSQRKPTSQEPASQAAAIWLAQLTSATAGQPVFVTPYDDADITALTRYGLNADLDLAYRQGRSAAGQALSRDFSTAAGGTPTSLNGLNGTAWPAGGTASRADLASLAASNGINMVVLDSTMMPPSPQQTDTPTAQATAPAGRGSTLDVLLSDDMITQVINSANSASGSPATAFSVEQRYLAETAMIAAERPNLTRSIVIAPPRRWDPPPGLAGDLLAETVKAPWLRSVSLGQVAAASNPAGQVPRQPPPGRVGGGRMGRSLLNQVRQLDQQVRLLKSIQLTPVPGLDRAMFAVESSAWRDGGQAGQQAPALARQIADDLARQEAGLKILVTLREQLTGRTGTVPVSISNRLRYDVKVRLRADAGRGVTVKKQPAPVTVAAGSQVVIKLPVTAAAVGSATLTLSLLTPGGTPIPGARASMTIQATHYGTLALVIIAAVLGVFMISSGVRTFRRRGHRARGGAPGTDPADASAGSRDAGPVPPDASPAAPDAAAGQPDWGDGPEEADTVVSDRFTSGRRTTGRVSTGHANGHDRSEAEETDDYAWTPGWTERR
jgi:Family of unknown function (DUF6049)